MADLGPFRRELRDTKSRLAKDLTSGISPRVIASTRREIEIKEEMLKNPALLEKLFIPLAKLGERPELAWAEEVRRIVDQELFPDVRDPIAYRRLREEYFNRAEKLTKDVRKAAVELSRVSSEVLIVRHNPRTIEIVDVIAHALIEYFSFHESDRGFLRTSPQLALINLLSEDRQDLFMALRLSVQMRADITSIRLSRDDKETWKDAAEFAIGCIPVIGNVVAAYEAYSGTDLFGRQLTDVERGILGASVLLPVAGRAVKAGRALYTSSRMAALYGDDAFKWSFSIAMGERISADAVALGKLRKADAALAASKAVDQKAAQELAAALKAMGIDAAEKAAPAAVDAKLVVAFTHVLTKHPRLAGLDALAIERIAKKAGNESHVKGQLLEELLENRIVEFLKSGLGKRALGLEHVTGPLQFIPGHLIRDVKGRQITDGILVRHAGDELEIVAVFEAKAGRHAARELSKEATSRSRLTKAAEQELRKYAQDVLEELQERARLEGTTVTETVESIMKDVNLTEAGGQIRRDIERLFQSDIFIGSTKAKVKMSPTKTKFFGVLPSDVRAAEITKELADAKIKNFEVIGAGVKAKELKDAAALITKLLNTP